MEFSEFQRVCANWHIQAYVTIYRNNKIIYQGEYYKCPKIILRCYVIERFSIIDVEMHQMSFRVSLKCEYKRKPLYIRW